MKAINRDVLVDGMRFDIVTVKFDSSGIHAEVQEESVVKKSGIAPAAGCDFVSARSSMDSINFYENQFGAEKAFETADFSLKNWAVAKAHCYCLPENLETVKSFMIAKMKMTVSDFIRDRRSLMDKMEAAAERVEA